MCVDHVMVVCLFNGNNGCLTILHDEGEKVVEMFLVLG